MINIYTGVCITFVASSSVAEKERSMKLLIPQRLFILVNKNSLEHTGTPELRK